ncbi:MAG: ABC transporter permease [Verrucomicrobia bacterium]|nr:ABC transporter permease [Verrucomicrobiota bacterium]
MNDLRYAARQLLKHPGFTLVAVLTLALGIGANTTAVCWMQNMVLRPYSGVTDQDRLGVLCSTHRSTQYDTVSYLDLQDYARLTNIFSGVIGSQETPACLQVDDKLLWAYGEIVTANFFDVLGVKPFLGRTFLPEEETKPGGQPVLVLGHGFWQRQFGADPGVIGRKLDVNRHSFTIVGVAPADFHGAISGLNQDFWAPVMMHREVANFGSLTNRSDRWLHTQARLQPGVSLERAQAAAGTLAHQLELAYPNKDRDVGMNVLPLWKSPYGGQAFFLPVLRILLAVSAGVLLIVAANVANLLLVRATARQKEIAIRLSLGAKRARLIRQLLTESLLLALCGGAAGVALAEWFTGWLRFFTPHTHLPIGYTFHLDARTLALTCLVTIVTGLIFGLAPAVQASRPDLHDTLKEGGRGSGAGGTHHRLRSALVIAEIALSLLLLVGAGLCIKGFDRARRLDVGFKPDHLLLAGLRIGMNGYTEETGPVFYRKLRAHLATLPGVEEAALSSSFPLGFEGPSSVTVSINGYVPEPTEDLSIPNSIVSPNYFATMRIPILDGRDFNERDDRTTENVAIVNETMAKRFWPGHSPIGRKLTAFGRTTTVVGVVRAGKYRSLNEPPRPYIYFPFQQQTWNLSLGAVLRTRSDPTAMVASLTKAVHEVDPGVEVWATLTMEEYMQAAFLTQRMAATLLVLLGVLALLLAAMGIYGVMAYVVSQRTHEIGIRMALGARQGEVLELIIAQGMRLAGIGVAAGVVGAVLVTRWLASFLYGVSPFDPVTFIGVALLLALVALLACWLPARRAARVDPMEALRCE